MPAPVLVQFEKEIDREMAKEGNMDNGNGEYDEDDMEPIEYGPRAQIVTNDLRSLDEMVSFYCTIVVRKKISTDPTFLPTSATNPRCERLDAKRATVG